MRREQRIRSNRRRRTIRASLPSNLTTIMFSKEKLSLGNKVANNVYKLVKIVYIFAFFRICTELFFYLIVLIGSFYIIPTNVSAWL